MQTLIFILIPLIISGLGFLTYKHPKISRQIINPTLLIFAISYFAYMIHYSFVSESYHNSIDALINTKPFDFRYKIVDKDSLYSATKDEKIIQSILIKNSLLNETNDKIRESLNIFRDSTISNIRVYSNKNRATYDEYSMFIMFGAVILFAFQLLSYLFDNIHSKDNNNSIDKTKNTPN